LAQQLHYGPEVFFDVGVFGIIMVPYSRYNGEQRRREKRQKEQKIDSVSSKKCPL
jgi:hypothetical protein